MRLRIERKLNQYGEVNNPLCVLLDQISERQDLIHNEIFNLRPPKSICVNGEKRFEAAINKLVDLVIKNKDMLVDEVNQIKSEEFFNLINETLGSFSSYRDDVYSIIKCFYTREDSAYKGDRNDEKWLAAVPGMLFNDFKKNAGDSNIFFMANNAIKHRQGRVVLTFAKSELGDKCYGFFINEFKSGAIQPYEDIHKDHTAFSFNWFIPEILGQFYAMSWYAVQMILKTIELKTDTKVNLMELTQDRGFKIVELVQKIETMQTRILFENEYKNDFTQIQLISRDDLLIKKPADKSYMKKFRSVRTYRISIAFVKEETQTYTLPYLKQR